MTQNQHGYSDQEVFNMRQEAIKHVKDMNAKANRNNLNNNNFRRNAASRHLNDFNSKFSELQSHEKVLTHLEPPPHRSNVHRENRNNYHHSNTKKVNSTNPIEGITGLFDSNKIDDIIKKIPFINQIFDGKVDKDTMILIAAIFILVISECEDKLIILALIYVLIF